MFYRTYSRLKEDGSQERWADTVIRNVEGCLSIRKDHLLRKAGVKWDESYWQIIGKRMAEAIFNFHFLPPGRGLWANGTEYIYERGGLALQNCGATEVTLLSRDVAWAMDALMCGVGVGFETYRGKIQLRRPATFPFIYFEIPDTREGWVESVYLLIESYELGGPEVQFDYSQIRQAGQPIRGFGGTASGPAPLMQLHERTRKLLDLYVEGQINQTQLITDIMNCVGACVVAGNVRRSAEIALGYVGDETFRNLKNYDLYPYRNAWGWMSNNSVVLESSDDFELLPEIADRIRDNGEPGVINLMNVQRYGRFKEKKIDRATLFNPCAEQPLEDKEVCCLVEVFPTRCNTEQEIYEAMELATLYASTVSLLPTHSPETNAVINRNHRIGVSISGGADWIDSQGASRVTKIVRHGYEQIVVPVNKALAEQAGVPASVRVTTVKPSGTISLLAGVSPGMHHPVFRYGIRRMRVSETSPVAERLVASGIPYEPDLYSSNTLVFEFPLESGKGKTRSLQEVSIWEQASIASFFQREWADNAVSNTLTFKPSTEGKDVEKVLATFAPMLKSMSMLPDQSEQQSYAQAPYERITKEEYTKRLRAMKLIDWDEFTGSDGQDSRFCSNDSCSL